MRFRIVYQAFRKGGILLALEDFINAIGLVPFEPKTLVMLPSKKKKFCVLRSPSVNKDSREQFEINIYKGFIEGELESQEQFILLVNTITNLETSNLDPRCYTTHISIIKETV